MIYHTEENLLKYKYHSILIQIYSVRFSGCKFYILQIWYDDIESLSLEIIKTCFCLYTLHMSVLLK